LSFFPASNQSWPVMVSCQDSCCPISTAAAAIIALLTGAWNTYDVDSGTFVWPQHDLEVLEVPQHESNKMFRFSYDIEFSGYLAVLPLILCSLAVTFVVAKAKTHKPNIETSAAGDLTETHAEVKPLPRARLVEIIAAKKAQIGQQEKLLPGSRLMDVINAKKAQIAQQDAALLPGTQDEVGTLMQTAATEENGAKLEHKLCSISYAIKTHPSYDKFSNAAAENKLKEKIGRELNEAVANMDEKDMWNTWTKVFNLMEFCHQRGYQDLPAYQQAKKKAEDLGLSLDLKMDLLKVDLGANGVKLFQEICDKSRCAKFDNLFSVRRFIVTKVVQVQHEQTHAEYILHSQRLKAKIDREGAVQRVTVASQAAVGGRRMQGDAGSLGGCDPAYNEFYLFHGTSKSVTDLIVNSDFLLKTKADHGWTFGRGIYAAEFLNHAQFFAQQVAGDGPGQPCCILMCRVFCGRCQDLGQWRHTSVRCDKADAAEKAIAEGKYHSSRGSEWPDCYDLREFVLPDDDQILPEFIIYGHSNCP